MSPWILGENAPGYLVVALYRYMPLDDGEPSRRYHATHPKRVKAPPKTPEQVRAARRAGMAKTLAIKLARAVSRAERAKVAV